MPRTKTSNNIASQNKETSAAAAAAARRTRSSRALKDVSNKGHSKQQHGAKEAQPLRRSARLSSGVVEARDPDPAVEQDAPGEKKPSLRRSTRRISSGDEPDPDGVPQPQKSHFQHPPTGLGELPSDSARNRRAASQCDKTRKQASLCSSSRTEESADTLKQAKRRREPQDDELQSKRARRINVECNSSSQRQLKISARSRSSNNRPTLEAVSLEDPRSLCSDFLLNAEYNLIRLQNETAFDSSKFTPGVAAFDECDKDNALAASDYVADIFHRLYNAESSTQPQPYMHTQPHLNVMMRSILVDWIVEVHMKFRLLPETLYLCVNIIDRYLSLVKVNRQHLQLVGVSALLIACKYEEIYAPAVRDCVYITDRAYTRQAMLDMEQSILKHLGFKISVPTAFPFLQRFLRITRTTRTMKAAANYYMERTLQEYHFLLYRPSLVAAAAVCLAINNPSIREYESVVDRRPGVPTILLSYTGFEASSIVEVARRIVGSVSVDTTTLSSRRLVSVKKKYDASRYEFISTEFDGPRVEDLFV